MSKAEKEQSTDCPLRFMWGTFCDKILLEPDTKLRSLIGIKPSIRAGVQIAIPKDEKVESVQIALGNLQVFMVFELIKPVTSENIVKYDVTIEFPGLPVVTGIQEIKLEPDRRMCNVTMNLQDTGISIPVTGDRHELTASVTLKYKDAIAAKVEMPIYLDVEVIQNAAS